MEIDLQTKIGTLLDTYPDMEETLLRLSPAFAKLRNPILRRTIAKVATVQQAAKIAGISPIIMIQALRKGIGLAVGEINNAQENRVEERQPEWFDKEKITISFDASSIIEAGQSPMSEIIRLSKELKGDDVLELIAPFRPEPIMSLLQSKGFDVWYNGRCYFKVR